MKVETQSKVGPQYEWAKLSNCMDGMKKKFRMTKRMAADLPFSAVEHYHKCRRFEKDYPGIRIAHTNFMVYEVCTFAREVSSVTVGRVSA